MNVHPSKELRPPWPNGARCAVCLTFDLDGETVWTSKISQDAAFGSATVRSLGRFGPETATPRILNLLHELRVPAGFFVVGEVADKYPDLVCEIHNQGHEVAHHSYSHINPARQSLEQNRTDFIRAYETLKRIVGHAPRGFRSPAADISMECWSLLAEYEFAYDSSLMTRELPYTCGIGEERIVEIPFHWLLDDWVHFGFNMYPNLPYMSGISSQEKVFEIWSEEFEGIYEAGSLCMIVMHPQIIGRWSRLRMLARLITLMQSRGDVWFATPLEVAAFWNEWRKGGVDEVVIERIVTANS